MKRLLLFGSFLLCLLSGCSENKVEWVTTSFDAPWRVQDASAILEGACSDAVIYIDVNATAQTISGFGSAASEQSWASLSVLSEADRKAVFHELFAPGAGGNFTLERTPLGASDFALEYYSYDDVDGDFALDHFSIARDKQYLLPFLQAALAENPALKIWASPWCPPAWMKVNKHYANTSTLPIKRRIAEMLSQMENMPDSTRAAESSSFGFNPMSMADNGLAEDDQILEGADAFNLAPEYLDAYARYFGRYVDAYRAEGVDIFMVMPQNEPNSAQWYPACTWTPGGLIQFIAALGPEMQKRGVEVYLGTMERADVSLWDQIVKDAAAGPWIKGLGFQWAGKDALPGMHAAFPDLPCYMSEQECGNGANDWAGVEHAWELMKHYLGNGCEAYFYWNTSLFEGEASTWGWNQNSLVTVNRADGTWRFTPEYYLLKHLSHYVKPGARYLRLEGSFRDNAMAFLNPGREVVVIAYNPLEEEVSVSIEVRGKALTFPLQRKTVNTLLL